MRAATLLLLCLCLAGCAGGALPGSEAAGGKPSSSAFTPSVTAAPSGQQATSLDPPEGSDAERAQQARAQCWMKVETQKQLKGIDQRIAYVDKCVADEAKARR